MDCDVVVAGAGPVGQLLALLLVVHGLEVTVIEQADAPYGLPRAASIDDEVLRIFQMVGLHGEILADAQVQTAVSFVTADGSAVRVLEAAAGELGHPPLVSIHQPSMERTMLAALARSPAHVLQGTRLEVIDQSAEGVTVWVRPTKGGPSRAIRARFAVGCDGGSSGVRSRLGVRFSGSTFSQRWLVVDALVDRPLGKVPHPYFVAGAERPLVTLPMSPGRHRWEWMLHPGEQAEDFLEQPSIHRLIDGWLEGEAVELERAVVYTFHSRTAERWRVGRILLAGDAAHVMPPFAGQGFSSGARDAANLAWKLAAVLRGAAAGLLDTYEVERRPHVESMQHLAVRWGGAVQTTKPHLVAARDRALNALDGSALQRWLQSHAKPLPAYGAGAFAQRPRRLAPKRSIGSLFPQPTVETDSGVLRLDDALSTGWTLLATQEPTTADSVATLQIGDDLRDTDGVLRGWLARHNADWVLLRPDRFVFACGPMADLESALSARRALIATPAGAPA